MVVFKHELKIGMKMLMIWTFSIAFMIVLCVLLYPQMGSEIGNIDEIYSNMGGFTSAFGMDKINMGTPMGFYGIECGNVLGIGASFFAAMLGCGMLAKEEHNHTAEFLLTHPICRKQVVLEKLLNLVVQILILNIICVILSIISFKIIDEEIMWEEFKLFHIAQTLMQIEIGFVCFGISAFLKRNSIGIGIGIATLMYFLNIVVNISEKVEFLKYVTPFKYSDAADIISSCELDAKLISIGMAYAFIGAVIALVKYSKKDISA